MSRTSAMMASASAAEATGRLNCKPPCAMGLSRKSPTTAQTGYITAAVIFWIFCFSMSRYARYWERRLDTGRRS